MFLLFQGLVYHVMTCLQMGHKVCSIPTLVLHDFPAYLTLGVIFSLLKMVPNSAWHVDIDFTVNFRVQEQKLTNESGDIDCRMSRDIL